MAIITLRLGFWNLLIPKIFRSLLIKLNYSREDFRYVLNCLAFIMIILLIGVLKLSKFKAFLNYPLLVVYSKIMWSNGVFVLTVYLPLIITFLDHSFWGSMKDLMVFSLMTFRDLISLEVMQILNDILLPNLKLI